MEIDELSKLLEDLVKRPNETEWIEFKENNLDPQRTGELISGLSNSANIHNESFGYLVFGVRDSDHKIVGTSIDISSTKYGAEDIEHWWAKMLTPRVSFRIYPFIYKDKNIVIIEVPATIDTPVSFSGTEFIRIGSITRQLREFPEVEKKIWNNSYYKNFEKNIAKASILNEKDLLALLDYSAYFNLLKFPVPTNSKAIVDQLEKAKLIEVKRGVYAITNLGAILIAKNLEDFPSVKRKIVRVITYKGNNKFSPIKEKVFRKGYALGFPDIIDYLDDQLPNNEEIKKAARLNRKMYPLEALRELVANALIHQDLNEKGTGIAIEIYNGRIEISNPGKPLVNVDRFMDNPKSRNEDLASLMRKMGYCEERGSGITKVVQLAEIFQLPAPKFEETVHATKVTLYSHRTLKQMTKSDKIRACYQHCTLKYITDDYMTNASLRKRFKILDKNYSIASRVISETISAGLIKVRDQDSKAKKYTKYIPYWA